MNSRYPFAGLRYVGIRYSVSLGIGDVPLVFSETRWNSSLSKPLSVEHHTADIGLGDPKLWEQLEEFLSNCRQTNLGLLRISRLDVGRSRDDLVPAFET